MDKIKLDLNIYQQAILRKEFKTVDGVLKLSRHSDAGKFIYSHVRWLKDKPELATEGIEIMLPDDRLELQYLNYPAVSCAGRKAISDYLDSLFSIKVNAFLVKSARHGYMQKNIIDAFIYHYGLPGTITTFEMIKQRDFRTRRNVKRIISDFLIKN